MENKQVVYIATPAGIFRDAIVSAENIGNCLVLNCQNATVVTSQTGEVFMKTVLPSNVELEEPDMDENEDGEVPVNVELHNVVQTGSTDFIRAFSDIEEAKVFQHNAETLYKLQQVCEATKARKEQEGNNE